MTLSKKTASIFTLSIATLSISVKVGLGSIVLAIFQNVTMLNVVAPQIIFKNVLKSNVKESKEKIK